LRHLDLDNAEIMEKGMNISAKNILILVVLSYLFFVMGNSLLYLTNPDEVFYAQTAKEMLQRGTWNVPYIFGEPQFEKPILTYWLIRVGFLLFGVTDFGARFFSSIFGIIGVVAVYLLALLGYKNEKKAFLSAMVLMSSGIYIGMARIILTDVIFSVLILLSLTSFYWAYIRRERKTTGVILFYVFSSLAVLTKGPLGFIIPLSVIILFLWSVKEVKFLFCKSSCLGFLIFLLIAVPWYALVIKQYGHTFTHEFFYNDHIRRLIEAEHKRSDTWYFYPLSTMIGMLPWSVFVLAALVVHVKNLRVQNVFPIDRFLICWIVVVFGIFQPAHSKLISYIMPMFPALVLMTGNYVQKLSEDTNKKTVSIFSLITCGILLIFPIILIFCPSEYSRYLPSKTVLWLYVFMYMVSMLFLIGTVIKAKYGVFNYLIVFQTLLFLSFVPIACKNINKEMSSGNVGAFLKENYKIEGRVLCTKHFVRGVRYYTDADVAVWGGGFFSPHPIPMLNSDEKVIKLLEEQPVTYCVLSRSSFKDLERITKDRFSLEKLDVIGEQYIAKVEVK